MAELNYPAIFSCVKPFFLASFTRAETRESNVPREVRMKFHLQLEFQNMTDLINILERDKFGKID